MLSLLTVMLFRPSHATYQETANALRACFDFFSEPIQVQWQEHAFDKFGVLFDQLSAPFIDTLVSIAAFNMNKDAIPLLEQEAFNDRYKRVAKELFQMIAYANILGSFSVKDEEIILTKSTAGRICRSLAIMKITEDLIKAIYPYKDLETKSIIMLAALSVNIASFQDESNNTREERYNFYKGNFSWNWFYFRTLLNLTPGADYASFGEDAKEIDEDIDLDVHVLNDIKFPSSMILIKSICFAIYEKVFRVQMSTENKDIFMQHIRKMFTSVTDNSVTTNFINKLDLDEYDGQYDQMVYGNALKYNEPFDKLINLSHLLCLAVDGYANKVDMLPQVRFLIELEQWMIDSYPPKKKTEVRPYFFSEFSTQDGFNKDLNGFLEYYKYIVKRYVVTEGYIDRFSLKAIRDMISKVGLETEENDDYKEICNWIDTEDLGTLFQLNQIKFCSHSEVWHWKQNIDDLNTAEMVALVDPNYASSFVSFVMAYKGPVFVETEERLLI